MPYGVPVFLCRLVGQAATFFVCGRIVAQAMGQTATLPSLGQATQHQAATFSSLRQDCSTGNGADGNTFLTGSGDPTPGGSIFLSAAGGPTPGGNIFQSVAGLWHRQWGRRQHFPLWVRRLNTRLQHFSVCGRLVGSAYGAGWKVPAITGHRKPHQTTLWGGAMWQVRQFCPTCHINPLYKAL